MTKSNRNGRLDALRGIAILLVLGVHFHFYPDGSGVIASIAAFWKQLGPVGVILFFVLSGFLIGSLLLTEMEKYSSINVVRFLIRRGFKLYPVYYVFIAYCILMPAGKGFLDHERVIPILNHGLHEFLTSLVFLQNYIPPNPAGHTWSLAVEEHFYLVFPFVMLLLGAARVWKWLIPICLSAIPICAGLRVLSVLHQQATGNIVLAAQNTTHLHVDALMIGVALAVTAVKFPNRFIQLGKFSKTLVVSGLALWALPQLLSFSMLSWAAWGSTMWLVGSAAILVGVCSFKAAGGNKRGILAWIGANSYAIYVWHVTVIGIVEKHLMDGFLTHHVSNEGLRWVLLVVITAGFCVLVGAVVTKLIESPALALRDRLFPSRGHAMTLPDQNPVKTSAPFAQPEPDRGATGLTLITATNDEVVLKNCLLNSPDIRFVSEVILQRGYASAAAAYNAAITKANTDLLAFVHQDVYLPEGWVSAVKEAVEIISRQDPDWGVLGVWGPQSSGHGAGFVYDGAWSRILGCHFKGGLEVDSLDEVVLVFRKSSGLHFDPRIPGFHMYGTDICLEARRRQRKCYAIAAFCIHNTNQHGMLPWQFWKGYLAMRRKWKAQLPVKTTCTDITYWCWPIVRWNFVRAVNLATGRDRAPVKRVQDARLLYSEIMQSGTIACPGGNVFEASVPVEKPL